MVNVGMSKTGGEDRVSTISLLGCSTSMALATGPTDEEEVPCYTLLYLFFFHLMMFWLFICL